MTLDLIHLISLVLLTVTLQVDILPLWQNADHCLALKDLFFPVLLQEARIARQEALDNVYWDRKMEWLKKRQKDGCFFLK